MFLGLLKLGDTILAMDTAAGGHISHGHPGDSDTGRDYHIVRYGVYRETELVDLDELRGLARRIAQDDRRGRLRLRPRARLRGLRAIADEVGAYLVVDMAHVAGLVATGLYPDPLPHAHVVTSTTYKSLRGARGGLVLWNDEALSRRIEAAASFRACRAR